MCGAAFHENQGRYKGLGTELKSHFWIPLVQASKGDISSISDDETFLYAQTNFFGLSWVHC